MNLREAAQQALEYLEQHAIISGIPIRDALRAALEPVTSCHELSKEGDKLSPPLPTLAVHVGYRYQSPVGGWEYGDHIPTGFDTNKWAHQKIYVLQEQS